MNYRRLSVEELLSLESEFVEFLVVNGITAPDWQKLKKEENKKSDRLIDLFSEVIFEGIFRKAKFLEIKTSQFIHTYQCLDDKIILVGLESTDKAIDFLSKEISIEEQVKQNCNSLQVFMTEKKYNKKREYELFQMTEKGCEITNGSLFKKLSLVYIENNQHD